MSARSAAVGVSVSGAGSSSSAGSIGAGQSNSTSGANNVSYGNAQVSSGPDNFFGNPGAVHNNVATSSGTSGGTYSTGNSVGFADPSLRHLPLSGALRAQRGRKATGIPRPEYADRARQPY